MPCTRTDTCWICHLMVFYTHVRRKPKHIQNNYHLHPLQTCQLKMYVAAAKSVGKQKISMYQQFTGIEVKNFQL